MSLTRGYIWIHKLSFMLNPVRAAVSFINSSGFKQRNKSKTDLLDVVVRQCASIFQLFSSKDQPLLIRRDSCKQNKNITNVLAFRLDPSGLNCSSGGICSASSHLYELRHFTEPTPALIYIQVFGSAFPSKSNKTSPFI